MKAEEGSALMRMRMQELEDRLQEHQDKLEHIRQASVELQKHQDVKQCLCEHVDWIARLAERVEALQMNTAAFLQMNARPRSFRGKRQGLHSAPRWGRAHVTDDAQSECGWTPARVRRNSDAASEVSCAW